MSENLDIDEISTSLELRKWLTNKSLLRVKWIVEILLENNTFKDEDLRYISLLSNNKYVAVINIIEGNIFIKRMSYHLEKLIGLNWLNRDIDFNELSSFIDHSLKNPWDVIFTNITIANGWKYLNIVYWEETKSFDFYFINTYQHNEYIMDLIIHDINIINEIVWIKDSETFKHTHRVWEVSSYFSTLIWKKIEFSDNIKLTAPLHDVWKVRIPDSILYKKWKLSKSEFDIIETHTTEWIKIIDKLSFIFWESELFELTKNIVLYHHEKYDWTWYPEWLVWDEIPIEARIVTIVDVFDALKSKRPYKEPFSDEKVKEILMDWRWTLFDPELLDIFLAHYYEMVWIRWLNEDIIDDIK